MLILSRKTAEKIIIEVNGCIIEVCPITIRNARVELGIKAPPHVTVHREEVAQKIAKGGSCEHKR